MLKMAKLFLIFGIALATIGFVAAGAANLPGPPSLAQANTTIKWIEQKLDHFNNTETRTWQMRYMVNDEFYEPGGPLFIFISGSESIWENPIYITKGLFYDTAKEHKAILLQTEHRFFGESRPTKDLTIENLKFLNAEQALADLAHFIRTIKSSNSSMNNSSVILAGENYSGAMVIWFKKLYPNLAVGGWALSPPLLAKLDFKEFKEVFGQSIRLVGDSSCYKRIANGMKEMETMLAQNRTAELKTAFNLCGTFDAKNDLDVATLSSYVSETCQRFVFYHNIEDMSIYYFCKGLMDMSDDFESLSEFVKYTNGNSGCSNLTYNHYIAPAKVTTFGNTSDRQTIYQMCNEFGGFPSTTSTQQPFGTIIPLSMFYFMCKDLFGNEFTPEYIERQINKTNKLFEGRNINLENVSLIYGQLDPWLEVGIKDVTKATIIPLASNIPYLDSILSYDTKELKAAKRKFKNSVKVWLKTHKKST